MDVRFVRDLGEARELWVDIMPDEFVMDLWEVRMAFHRHFRRPFLFLVEESGGKPAGLLPLSWIEEQGNWAFFPGETWRGRTWLEQNVIVSSDPKSLLASVPGPIHIRYLSPRSANLPAESRVDETGYLFEPPRYGYDMAGYRAAFSGKSFKRIRKEVETLQTRGVTWRLDRFEDFDLMVSMNLARFGTSSYFADPRFRRGFTDMVRFFAEAGWLRVTTAMVGGYPAAVDVGVLHKGVYTLMAGGTDPECSGIAKLINLHHMERACAEQIRQVDFLCGEFNWKKMFHLTERPLYLLSEAAGQVSHGVSS
ncbi:MAG: GNAT family N-acetyltransferase [bacterium]|nr:GNAT family N-acetyltransferase [bacterium]